MQTAAGPVKGSDESAEAWSRVNRWLDNLRQSMSFRTSRQLTPSLGPDTMLILPGIAQQHLSSLSSNR